MKKLLLLFLLAPMLAFSQTIYVTPTGAGAMNGTSWANAYPGTQLQTALNNVALGGQVWVATGTYLPTYQTEGGDARTKTFYINRNIKVYGGFPASGSPILTDRNPTANVTTLSGDIDAIGNADAYHVVSFDHVPSTTLIDGFTITKGRADGSTNLKQIGGGIYNDGRGAATSSSPAITNCIFKNCYALGGSGILNDGRTGGAASPTITNCTFTDNTGGRGGGIYNVADTGGRSNPTITACIFSNNVVEYFGGGILNFATGNNSRVSPFIFQCTFTNNKATNPAPNTYTAGGAIANYAYDKGVIDSFIDNCTFTNNLVSYSGGAIWNYSHLNAGGTCSPNIRNCSFIGNTAQTHVGGAIFNSANEVSGSSTGFVHPNIENCLFRGNTAVYGGAAYNYSAYGSCKPRYVSCTFNNNSATNFGGTLGNNTDFGIVDVLVVSSIFWGNSGTDKNISIQTVTAFNIGNSLLDEASCPANVNCFGGNLFNVDPLFIDAPNGNLRLQACSPAINTGFNSTSTPTDLDGNPREVGQIDMGAYEAPEKLCIKASVSASPACAGSTITLSANGGTTYSWKGPNNFSSTSATPSLIVSALTKGVYSVTGVSGTITGSATVSVNIAMLQAGVAGTPCVGGTLQLTASGMTTYSWTRPANNFNSTLQNPVILSAKLTDAGMYLVTGRSGLCMASTMVMVIVNSQSINPAFTVSPSSIAQGASVTLSATSSTGTYSWSGPDGFSGSTKSKTINSFQPVNNGVYRLTLISGLCKGYSEKTLTINVAPRLAGEETQQEIAIEINAYPNPVTDKLTVEVTLKEPLAVTLQLFNSMGKESGTWQLNDETTVHKTELNVSELQGGMYLLQAQTSKHKIVKKVLKAQY